MSVVYWLGLLPTCFLLLYLVMALLFDKYNANKKHSFFKYKSPLEYAGNNENLFETIFAKVTILVYSTMFLVAILNFINAKYFSYCMTFLEDINSIEGILMAYFAVVISVIIFSATLGPKRYYLTVTREDLHKHYYIHTVYQSLVLSAFISLGCVALLQSPDLNELKDYLIFIVYEICCLVVAFGGVYILCIIGMSAIGDKRMELYSLNKLYQIFWNSSILKLVNRTEDVIYENSGYLLHKYIALKLIKRKKLSSIQRIKYKENIFNNQYWLNFSKKRVSGVSLLFCFIFTFLYSFNKEYIFLTVNIVLMMICLYLICSKKTKLIIDKCVVDIVLGRNGYEITYLDKKYFVGDMAICSNKALKKYIRNIKNIMALYCIICSCWEKKKKSIIEESIEEMIDFLKEHNEIENDKTESHLGTALYFLPVFTSGYYYYLHFGKETFPIRILRLYDELKLTNEDKKHFFVILNSFISDASRFRPSDMDKKAKKDGKWSREYYEQYIKMNGYWELLLSMSHEK